MIPIRYFSKYTELGPSSRYRVYQFLNDFHNAGIDLKIFPLFDNKYFEILRSASSNRIIKKCSYVLSRFRNRIHELQDTNSQLTVIEHQLFPYLPAFFERRYIPRKYLIEFDDAIYLTHPHKMRWIIQNAAGIIVGNKYLAEYAKQFNNSVHIIPTVIDVDRFKPDKKMSDKETSEKKLSIGWSGLEYNFKYLHLLTPIMNSVLKKYPVELVVISGSRPQGFEFPFRFVQWDPERESEQLNQFDIGLMPLMDDTWSKSKCGMKLLQYMAVGVPGIATAVGVNTEIIQNGKNGFTISSLQDWEQKLAVLIENASLRREMGAAARSTIVERYSTKSCFPKLLELYRQYLS